MFFTYLAVVFFSSLSLLRGTQAAPAAHKSEVLQPKAFINQETYVYPRLEFVTRFSTCIPPNTDVRIKWEGGSGQGVEVYYIPQWPGQLEYFVSFFETRGYNSSRCESSPSLSTSPKQNLFSMFGVRPKLKSIPRAPHCMYNITQGRLHVPQNLIMIF